MVFGHGIGGAQDLPIPAPLAVAGAAAALVVSFIVLALAWRSPRFDAGSGGRATPSLLVWAAGSTALAVVLRILGMTCFAYVGWAAVAGPDLLVNPTFGVFYVLLWVGIVPASLLFGPFYKAINPVRTLHLVLCKLTGNDPERGLVELPGGLGRWPAALGLFAFVWLELAYSESTYLAPVRLFVAVYVAVVIVGGVVFGSRWIEQADPFEAYSTMVGRLAVLGRRDDGTLVFRSPLANLDATPPMPGLVAVVAVLLGSTAFDSFARSSSWLQLTQASSLSTTLLNTCALMAYCAVVGLTFTIATRLSGVATKTDGPSLPAQFAHSLVPIVVGYIVAHYLSYFVEVGQQTVVLLSDPLGRGDDLLGTANWQVSYWLSEHPQLLAVVKVLAVVTGHVLGVVAAHDRAVRLLPKRHQVVGQLPLLVVMVLYTVGGLYLLFDA
ncbi:hypothetical protein BH18ACT9_BH18ACT9_06850 [soil metagenome]